MPRVLGEVGWEKTPRLYAGRGRAHETAGSLHGAERALQIVDVGHSCLVVAHRDRRIAGRRLAPRAAWIAEHALLQLREVRKGLIDEGVAGAAEAREDIPDVSRVAP